MPDKDTRQEQSESLRQSILSLVEEYHASAFPARDFVPAQSHIPVSGKVFDSEEMRLLVDAALDFWLTAGRYADRFESEFAKYVGVRSASLVNSGSSANLCAVSALTSPQLKERRLVPGDEVITVAAGFPTTVNPIFQNGLVPVYVDVQLQTYDVDPSLLESALGPRTKAIILAHTLGNPFDLAAVTAFARKHGLWLIEDCCDALGATYGNKKVGTFGDLATVSFYPAHQITMGEGGCVLTDKPALEKLVVSFRDWGRDCWCAPGKDNTCGKRFAWEFDGLPCGFDHKYIYSHIGYNLKLTDMQAAIGVAQLRKLEGFIEARRKNFELLKNSISGLEEFFLFPSATPGSEPSWFGFPLAVRPGSGVTRNKIVQYLESKKIATRLLFAANLTKQPAYQGANFRVAGSLPNTEFVMDNVFWIGLFPAITPAMIAYMADTLRQAVLHCQAASPEQVVVP
jgi:CDP-6-deoxy-D-xylo-4-hexulose-3-dehydrase